MVKEVMMTLREAMEKRHMVRKYKDEVIPQDVVKALEEQLSCEIKTSPLTQYNGALGAALFAYQGALKHAKA